MSPVAVRSRRCSLAILLLIHLSSMHRAGSVQDGSGHHFTERSDRIWAELKEKSQEKTLSRCASACSASSGCRFLQWSPASQECSHFSRAADHELAEEIDRYREKEVCRSPRTDDEFGNCRCANGRYGALCDKPFNHQLQLRQEILVPEYVHQDHIEIGGISYLLWVSYQNGTNPGMVAIFAFDSAADKYVPFQNVTHHSKPDTVATFAANGNHYFFLGGDVPPHALYKFDGDAKRFSKINDVDGSMLFHAAAHMRPNGDVYLCYAVRSSPGPPPLNRSMDILRFDAAQETLVHVFAAASTIANHSNCAFVEMSGTLFAYVDLQETLYRMKPDGTWQPYQSLQNGNLSTGIAVVYSPKLATHLLATGSTVSGTVFIHAWNGSSFNLFEYRHVVSRASSVLLVTAAGETHLLLDDSGLACAKFFERYRLVNETRKFALGEFFTGIKADGSFRHFWFNDNLYLVVTSKDNCDFWYDSDLQRANSYQRIYHWK